MTATATPAHLLDMLDDALQDLRAVRDRRASDAFAKVAGRAVHHLEGVRAQHIVEAMAVRDQSVLAKVSDIELEAIGYELAKLSIAGDLAKLAGAGDLRKATHAGGAR